MQSFREQSSYGNQQTYPPEAHTPSRLEDYNPRQQAQIFQSSYGGRRGGAGTPAAIPPGENANLQSYQSYRKESGDFYYISNKEGAPSGSQTPQRRPPGSVQSYGPPQGNNNNSSGSSSSSTTGFGTHYGREVHHSQYTGQHSAAGALSQYSQEFTGSFSAAGGQYPTHVPSQQLRQQIYQPHSQSGNTATTASTPHLPQIQRSASISSPTGYQLRVGQFGQHYQTSSSSSSSAFPNSQRFGQSGAGYEGYSPGSTNTPYESHIPGSSYATQQAYSSYTSQHLKGFEASKVPQGGQQQQQPPHIMQYSNASKMPLQSQVGQYSQSEVPVRSPMQFQQNFSPISNPSPAASVVQSPSCSSTPSPLMTSGENLQCGQGNVSLPSRNRILQIMPQLSPNTHAGGFKNFGTEGPSEKRLTDPGLSSLNALSSQVANLPNTVQHMLLSDALAPHKKTSKRTSRKTDSCANSETSSQAEEHLKSPLAESLDGSCSSSSGDPIERVRQLSGQSTSSENGYKGPSVEKLPSPVQVWQNEPPVKTPVQEIENVPENTEAVPEVCKPNEKSVGVIVSMETVANRSEKTSDEILTPSNDTETIIVQDVPDISKDEDVNDCTTSQNGDQDIADSNSLSAPAAGPQTEDSKSPVESGYSFHEEEESQNASSLPPKNVDVGGLSGPCDRKPGGGRSEKFPSLLQEVLQGHHQQERRYARSTQEPTTVTTNAEVSLRPNVLISQTNELPNRSILGKTLAPQLDTPHWGPWDRKPTPEIKQINLNDYSLNRKYEVEPSVSSHESVTSERRSVICDISPLRQLVREPTSSHHIGSGQERPDGRPGQSVILQSGVIPLDAKSNNQTGTPKLEDLDTTKMHRKRIVEHCMPYSTKDSARNKDPASPRSMTYDPNPDYGSQSRSSHSRRGTGRVGSRGRSPAQSQDLADKLKMSPGRSRGPTDIHHINQTMSFSERASREAFYSAFFQNTDSPSIGYHANSRSSSYGEPHPAFTSPLHYKRQMYQQEEYKEWLGNSTQALLSASQHRAEMQRKSPRQEQFPVRSPGRSETEVLNYNQTGTYHDHSSMDFNRPLRVGEGGPNNLTLDLKRTNQKTPPGESSHWNHSRQVSPVKKIGSPTGTIQKPLIPVRESDTHGSRQNEPGELAKTGCNAHRPLGPDEQSHHNPLIMRRRVRSFISPIPSKRQLPDDRSRTSSYAPKEAFDKTITHVMSSGIKENDFSLLTEDTTKGNIEERSPPSMSLSSPAKTKILPPRKGRGLKLEAIVQKITSPNVRRISTPSSAECLGESVTLDDILSLKIKGPEGGNTSLQETNERSNDVVLDVPCTEETNVKGLSPKSIEAWITQDDKKIKKEIEEQFMETKDFVQSGAPLPHDTNHYIEGRVSSSPLEQKCSMPMIQQREGADKEKLVGTPCSVTPKQEITPPKGYFPSGKKKGRPIGSVNKQKKQQQLEEQLARTSVEPSLSASSPAQPQTVLEQGSDAEPKPKRRRREGRKPAGTPRRRRGKPAVPIVAPIEPEIKLKYASQPVDKSETKAKPFFPYIHVENKEDLGLACLIINAEDEEQRWKKVTSARKGQRSTSPQPSSESKALPASSFMVQGPAITESTTMGPLVCCFCGKWANYRNLGDLFGPFYTQEYASTLSKNPPPKKTSETLSAVKVRHKVASHGSKTDSDEEEEEEPQQAREQRSLSAHPRYKRRNRSGDCASSRLSLPSRRKTTDPCELTSVDSTVATPTADGVPDQGFQVPQLPLDSNEFWMHEGCVLWANGVYLVCGRLYGLQEAIDIAREMKCSHCQEAGATLGCYNKGCACCYHFPCAMDSECLLNEENFSVRCPKHKTKTIKGVTAEQPEQG